MSATSTALQGTFALPVFFDLGATFAFALSGALAAIKRHYDIVGVLALALVTGLGGGLIRDGLFLAQGPTPLLINPHYLEAVVLASLCGVFLGARLQSFGRVIAVFDALGLGAYAAFGVQKALLAGLAPPAAILVGVVNAVGGSILRDLLCREEPLVFKPGQFYFLNALGGAVVFVFSTAVLGWSANRSAIATIVITFIFRVLTIVFNWRTAPVSSGNLIENDPPAPPKS